MKDMKFKELAEKRVTTALRQFRLIGNLSNRNSYEYTTDQVDKIFAKLQAELAQTKARFVPRQQNGAEKRFVL